MRGSKNRRVVVTCLGAVSPIGNNIADTWAAAIEGKSGIANITKFDATAFSTRFAGEVKGFNIEDYISAKEARHMDTFIHYGMAAGIQAVQDSGVVVTEENADRIGVMNDFALLQIVDNTKDYASMSSEVLGIIHSTDAAREVADGIVGVDDVVDVDGAHLGAS